MQAEAKTVLLRDAREYVLRTPEVGDAAQMLDFVRVCAAQTEYILLYADECPATVSEEEAFVESARISPHALMLACFDGARVIANSQIVFSPLRKTKHRAQVAVAVRQCCWGIGAASAMFAVLFETARRRGAEKIELGYIQGNERARRFYEKEGFAAVGERPDAFRLSDGSARAEIFMCKTL